KSLRYYEDVYFREKESYIILYMFKLFNLNNCFIILASNPEKKVEKRKDEDVTNVYRNIMRKVPQPVTIVTSAEYDILHAQWIKRGMTCTSFTNVSYQPSIISICINKPSRMHDLLLRTQKFAIHVLAKDQVQHGVHFAKSQGDDACQFKDLSHEISEEGLPLISNCAAVMECRAHFVHTVGDHHVWYGEVTDARLSDQLETEPLLYFTRSFRSVGDEIFLKAFEDATLPFEDWTHEAHLRMAWNYITEHGKEGATPLIRKGILRFNKQNKEKIKFGYHETITMFYTNMVADAVKNTGLINSFEEFLEKNKYLLDRTITTKYYSKEKLFSDEARHM
ncbi:hypothetical protein FSP39_016164, partial [Pinctada imbricata]